MADTTKPTIKNISEGPRGVTNAAGDTVMLERGETRNDIELTAAELRSAKATGYFQIGGSSPTKAVSLKGKSRDELLKIAEDEEVAIPETATDEQIVKAIEQKRKA